MKTEKVSFKNNLNQKIAGRIYGDEPFSQRGIIFCHGLFSTKDGYKIKWLARYLVEAGFTLLTFDFSFVGESEGHISDLSVLQEVEDLKCAYSYFLERDINEIHLIGSSIGGLVSLLFSSSADDDLKSLTLIATPVKLFELMANITDISDIESLSDEDTTSIDGVPVKNKFIKEMRHIDTATEVTRIKCPTLIIHGRDDIVVDISNAEDLNENLKSEKKLIIIDDGDHNLSRDGDLIVLKKQIVEWLQKYS